MGKAKLRLAHTLFWLKSFDFLIKKLCGCIRLQWEGIKICNEMVQSGGALLKGNNKERKFIRGVTANLGSSRYCQVLPGITRCYQVVPGITRYCQVVLCGARWYQVVPGGSRYCQVLPGVARYCQILPGGSRWCQVMQDSALLKGNDLCRKLIRGVTANSATGEKEISGDYLFSSWTHLALKFNIRLVQKTMRG